LRRTCSRCTQQCKPRRYYVYPKQINTLFISRG
jgi:hypothetical protein